MNKPKLVLLGLGLVGHSLIKILLESDLFLCDDIKVIDMSSEAFEYYNSFGGKKENFIQLKIERNNYHEIFSTMKSGDFLIRLANGIDDKVLLDECMKRDIHYICSSDDIFLDTPDIEPFLYRTHFYQYKELIKKSKGCATSIIQFGMNPGLISILTKKALIDIVENDDSKYVVKNRVQLKSFIDKRDFPGLARALQVTNIIEADWDATETDIKEDDDTVYNTWNLDDFYEEMYTRSIQKLGTLTSLTDHLKRFGILPEQIYYYNKNDGTLVLDVAGKNMMTEANIGDKIIKGCIDAHEELFSIHDYYTIRNDDGEIDYAPSVLFVYRPSDIALNSVYHKDIESYQMGKYKKEMITIDKMVSGTELVGVSVEGKNIHTFYVGVAPHFDKNSFETPTILAVSSSIYAAVAYIFNHSNDGILYPENLDVNEILSYTKKFLPIVSMKIG